MQAAGLSINISGQPVTVSKEVKELIEKKGTPLDTPIDDDTHQITAAQLVQLAESVQEAHADYASELMTLSGQIPTAEGSVASY